MDDKSYYESGHAGYQAGVHALNDSRIANLIEALVLPAGARVLDVGCGDMLLSKYLTKYTWTGIDLDTSKDPRIIKQDVTSTPYSFKDGEFDAVVCSEVLEHLFDPITVIKECYRLTKSKFVLTVPCLSSLAIIMRGPLIMKYDPDNQTSVEHIRWYTPDSMIDIVEKVGFTVKSVVGNSPHLSPALRHGREWLKKRYPERSVVELDQLIGNILPGFCPGFLMSCEKI